VKIIKAKEKIKKAKKVIHKDVNIIACFEKYKKK